VVGVALTLASRWTGLTWDSGVEEGTIVDPDD